MVLVNSIYSAFRETWRQCSGTAMWYMICILYKGLKPVHGKMLYHTVFSSWRRIMFIWHHVHVFNFLSHIVIAETEISKLSQLVMVCGNHKRNMDLRCKSQKQLLLDVQSTLLRETYNYRISQIQFQQKKI